MSVIFTCGNCSEQLAADAELVGMEVRCSECGSVSIVPGRSRGRVAAPEPDESYSSDEPPRRKRSRSSPLLRVVLILLGLLALVVCGAGIAALRWNDRPWQTVHPKPGGFRVDVPERLQKTEEDRQGPGFNGPTTIRTTRYRKMLIKVPIEVYEVSVTELPMPLPAESVGPFLDVVGNGIVQQSNMKVVRKSNGTMGGETARVWELERNGQRGVLKLTTKGTRVYSQTTAGRDFDLSHPKVNRFFESFTFE